MSILPMYIQGYSATKMQGLCGKTIHLTQDILKSITDADSYKRVFTEAFSEYEVQFNTTPTIITGYDGLRFYNGNEATDIIIKNFKIPKSISITYSIGVINLHYMFNLTFYRNNTSKNAIVYAINQTSNNYIAGGCYINGSYAGANVSNCCFTHIAKQANVTQTAEWKLDCVYECDTFYQNYTHTDFYIRNSYYAAYGGAPTEFIIEDLKFTFD